MSVPISYCLIVKASQELPARGLYYRCLLEKMRYNCKHGAFTIVPCRHEPCCPELTSDQVANVDKYLIQDLKL